MAQEQEADPQPGMLIEVWIRRIEELFVSEIVVLRIDLSCLFVDGENRIDSGVQALLSPLNSKDVCTNVGQLGLSRWSPSHLTRRDNRSV